MPKHLWLPSFYSSGMILQQQVPNLLRGRARPDAQLTVSLERRPFDNRAVSPLDVAYGVVFSQKALADEEGGFSVVLPPFSASFDPFTLQVSDGAAHIVIEEILFGEIWISAGQSNMQLPLSACVDEQQLADLANIHYIRFLTQNPDGLTGKKAVYSITPHDDIAGAVWRRGNQPEAMAQVSASAFSFARELLLELKIPIGIIETALRGTHIHAWISRDSVDQQTVVCEHVKSLGYYRDDNDWNLTGSQDWMRHQPGALYNSKIAPLHGLGARGVIFQHGDSDYQYPAYYLEALTALSKDWQQVFRPAHPRGLAFLIIQLPPAFHGHFRFEQLAEFNEMLAASRYRLSGPTAIVPVYNLSPDFKPAPVEWQNPRHALSKLAVGQHLKTVALGLLYSRKAPSSAPELAGIEIVGSKMMLSFSNIGEGLRLAGEGTRLRGFAISGPDRVFLEAQARLLYGLKVLVWHDQISQPEAVTYAYADLNGFANLVSRDHLPVVPFRSDRIPSRYSPPQEWTHCETLKIWSCPRFDQPEATGWHPVWRVERGTGEIKIDKANKSEGDGALFFKYHQADTREFSLEPQLGHDSMFPPLDLSAYGQIAVDVFNPDQQIKHLQMAFAAGPADAELEILPDRKTILPALRWQHMHFDLSALGEERRSAIRRLVFVFEDHKSRGTLYMDNIRLLLPT